MMLFIRINTVYFISVASLLIVIHTSCNVDAWTCSCYLKRNVLLQFTGRSSSLLTVNSVAEKEDTNDVNNSKPVSKYQQEEEQQLMDCASIPLRSLLFPSSSCSVDQMSGTDLAYIGDVVYELYIRTRTIWPLKRTTDLQQQVVAYVRAEHQSKLLHQLRQQLKASTLILDTNNITATQSPFVFTVKEEQVMNRGRNAASKNRGSSSNHRHHPMIYQDSTALEALIGYLYISNTARCMELLDCIDRYIDIV